MKNLHPGPTSGKKTLDVAFWRFFSDLNDLPVLNEWSFIKCRFAAKRYNCKVPAKISISSAKDRNFTKNLILAQNTVWDVGM